MARPNKTRARLIARLDPYWKMEFANMAIIPLLVLYFTKARIGWVTLVPMAATVLLLGIGTAYWWFKVRQLKELPVNGDRVLGIIASLQRPALILTVIGCGVAALGWMIPSLSLGLPDRVAASVCAALAAPEYVNYYHRQLQHFDNWADFKRMLAGKGFRRSWMARDLAEWRGRSAP